MASTVTRDAARIASLCNGCITHRPGPAVSGTALSSFLSPCASGQPMVLSSNFSTQSCLTDEKFFSPPARTPPAFTFYLPRRQWPGPHHRIMASNTSTLVDEDGESSDWIEIQNTSTNSVNLLNWALTDSAGNPASGVSGHQHSAQIFYDRLRLRQKTAPRPVKNCIRTSNFPPTANIWRCSPLTARRPRKFRLSFRSSSRTFSYGIGMQFTATTLVATNAAIHYLIPTDSSVDGIWTQTNFDDSSWQVGTNGIGYETGIVDPQEESFAAKVLATQPVAYWRLNETTGPTAVNLAAVASRTEGVMWAILFWVARARARRHFPRLRPTTTRRFSTARAPTSTARMN